MDELESAKCNGSTPSSPTHTRLRDCLWSHQDEIIAFWTERIRLRLAKHRLSNLELIDHIPDILTHIASAMDSVGPSESASFTELSHVHAIARPRHGYELHQVILEYRVLRWSILHRWQTRIGDQIDVREFADIRYGSRSMC